MSENRQMPLPTFAIVTPSYNQGLTIAGTLDSVLGQDYAALEYAVIDGGSSDSAVDHIRARGDELAYWCSEPDNGMYDAINRGFARVRGEIMGWINSDDQYLPWTLEIVAEIFETFPEIEWLTSLQPMDLDSAGRPVRSRCTRGFNRAAFERGEQVPLDWYATNAISQECTFWRRSLWDRAGGAVADGLQCAADLELWARFFRLAELYGVTVPLAGARRWEATKKSIKHEDLCREETMAVFADYGIRPRHRLTRRLYPRLVRSIPPRALRFSGLVRPTKVCYFWQGRWLITTGYTGISD